MAIALSPVPMVCIVLVLMSTRPVRAGLSFAAGWLGALAIAIGIVAGFTDAVAEDNEEAARNGVDLVQLGIGVLFAILAVRFWRRRPEPGAPPPRPAVVERIVTLSAPALVLTGAAAVVANVKNLPLVLGAGGYIGGAGLGPGAVIGAAAVFVTAASLTVLVPLLAVVVIGAENSTPTLKALETWLLTNLNTITIVLLLVLAAVMTGNGLDLFR